MRRICPVLSLLGLCCWPSLHHTLASHFGALSALPWRPAVLGRHIGRSPVSTGVDAAR